MSNARPQIGAYYFPNYHRSDRRNAAWHGEGWCEWELVKRAEPRFPGHLQPRVPLWGYEDESEPAVMGKKIVAAADAGIDAFIFDWYWYEDGPFLERALEEGFLRAPNTKRLKFSLMWANHDWVDVHPATRNTPPRVLAPGCISARAFHAACDRMIDLYFPHPSYWRVNGGLYLSFYMIAGLVQGIGSVEAARTALDHFRDRVRGAGLGELHLNAVVWGEQILPGEKKVDDVNGLLDALGFDSVGSYVWIHHRALHRFPVTSYPDYRELCVKDFAAFTDRYRLPYFPNVTVGWDSSPRTIQSDQLLPQGYPYTPILAHNEPAEFQKALEAARAFFEKEKTRTPVLTVNSWNEWTEGSYLEPDTLHGCGYLDALRKVFGATVSRVGS
ncbi:MAG TPA: glycoside hydrolase family 99-like domain-containing protein [Bryobacteraceae bacterium]|nr:glycoside hydrolase family 99-like domain-containing protein [Bryobacteraceae bacterium]